MSLNKRHTICFQKSNIARIGIVTFLMLFSLHSFAQKNIANLQGKELQNRIQFNFIPVQMPTDFNRNLDPIMGLVGVHYQIPINDWWYGGIAMHAALTGDQGGLFTLGAELGIQQKMYKNIYFDANFHFGGGGGYRYLINDGAFINPNIGLFYKRKQYNFGIQFSHLHFYTGEIKSNSLSFFISIPSILRFANYQEANKTFAETNNSNVHFWKKSASKNVQQIRFDFLFPIGNSKRDDLSPLTNTLSVLGFEYQKHLNPKTFIFVHTDAIYKGLRAGFMDLFLGVGYHPYQSKYFDFFTKLALGAAGGRVAPEGGLMVYPSAGIDFKINSSFALSTHAGYYRALDGDLEAYSLGFGLKYIGLNNGTLNSSEEEKYTNFKTQGIRVSFQNQTYFKVQKTDSPTVDLQLLGLQFNVDLSKTFYLIGEAGFAYDGESGGYAHGLAGLGMYSPYFFNQKFRGHLEAVIGAAGGAGVATGEGVVVRPTIGLSYAISNGMSITASAGKMKALSGNLNSTNINIGLSFGLSTLTAKK